MEKQATGVEKGRQLVVVRDVLAGQRTILANERTLMSVIRTFLSLFAAGMALLKLFDHPWAVILGILMLIASFLVLALGGWSYVSTRKLVSDELASWDVETGF